jgi:hypothetical protein
MQNQTYRQSPNKMMLFFFVSMVLILFLFVLGTTLSNLIALGLSISTSYVGFVSKVHLTLPENEISLSHFEKTKTLRWSDIGELTDYKLWMKMSNYQNDVEISINCLLKNYSEIRQFISRKRPDLFN